MQTEPEEDDAWYRPLAAPTVAKKPYMSLTKRLLLRSQEDRAKLEERRKASLEYYEGFPTNGVSEPTARENMDVEMQDAGSGHRPPSVSATEDATSNTSVTHLLDNRSTIAEPKPPPPPLWPTDEQSRPVNGYRTTELKVQLPLKPSFSSDSTSNTPLVETPTSTVSQLPITQLSTAIPLSFPHSLSSVVQPSPIKKKVSLGEYFASRRKGSQVAVESQTSGSPTMQQGVLKPSSLTNGISREAEMQGSVVVDMPKGEESNPIGQCEKPIP